MATNNAPPNKAQSTVGAEPPKKKRKKEKSNFWLVKIPNWVADEWFDDRKYPNGSRLGELYVIPNQNDETKKTMKLELTRPHPITTNNNNHNHHNHHSFDGDNGYKQFDDIPIPTQFKMEQRKQRNRVNVKHGSLVTTGADKLLVFHDKPSFPVGSKVEALDNSRNNNGSSINNNDSDDEIDEDDDIKMKASKNGNNNNKKRKKGNSSSSVFAALKGYERGIIKEINNDRTFTVEFNKTKKQRYKVPEKDIRFVDNKEADKANKCKIWGVVNGEMDVTPQWTSQYQKFLQLRAMKKSHQHKMQITERENIYDQSRKAREKAAEEAIKKYKRGDNTNTGNKRNNNNEKKPKRTKNVRKDERLYENMIFAAFEKESTLNQRDIELKTGEPWNFLRPIVQRLCARHQNSQKNGRSWVLKPEYRLATDQDIENIAANDDQSINQ